jgi:hypothetical protein
LVAAALVAAALVAAALAVELELFLEAGGSMLSSSSSIG